MRVHDKGIGTFRHGGYIHDKDVGYIGDNEIGFIKSKVLGTCKGRTRNLAMIGYDQGHIVFTI